MTMVKIPNGSFTRHDTFLLEQGQTAPVQTVTISHDFVISDREVSIEQFHEFYGDPNCKPEEKPHHWGGQYGHEGQTVDHPIQSVSWFDSVAFCNWLSRKEGLAQCYEQLGLENWRLVPAANGYRLPTAAEWELACRAGTTTKYHFGNDTSLLKKYSVYNSSAPEKRGSRMPTRCGLFDMTGNIYEWCYDWSGPYRLETPVRDPIGIKQRVGDIDMRAMRGGMYYDPARTSGSSSRNRSGPAGRSNYSGFRVARSTSDS